MDAGHLNSWTTTFRVPNFEDSCFMKVMERFDYAHYFHVSFISAWPEADYSLAACFLPLINRSVNDFNVIPSDMTFKVISVIHRRSDNTLLS